VSGSDSGIFRANIDGTNKEELIANDLRVDNPRGIALDLVAGKIYWTEVNYNGIYRANLDGTGIEDLVTSGVENPASIALDLNNGKMYWTDPYNMDISCESQWHECRSPPFGRFWYRQSAQTRRYRSGLGSRQDVLG